MSGVEVAGVAPRRRRGHAVAVRTRRNHGVLRRQLAGSPWRRDDLLKLAVFNVVGLAGIVVCWIGTSGETDFDDQTRWTAFAALAAGVAAVGGASWLLAGLGAVARERRLLRDQLAVLYSNAADTANDRAAVSGSGWVTAPGMRHHHHPSCDVMRGKSARPVLDLATDGLSACGMCQS